MREATSTDYYVLPKAGDWNPASCSGAQFVTISRGLVRAKEIYSAVLTAKVAGLAVKFYGSCINSSTFAADYVIVE